MTGLFPLEMNVRMEFGEYLMLSYVLLVKRIWWFLAIIFLWVIYSGISAGSDGNQARPFLMIIIPSLFFIVFFVAIVYRAAKKNMKTVPLLNQSAKYTITENYIAMSAGSFESKSGWDMVIKVREAAGIILLYGSNTTAYILPVRCFRDEQQVRDFRAFIREKVGNK